MTELCPDQMAELVAGRPSKVLCGVGVGATIGSGVIFGVVGIALTVNKALAACTLAAFR